MSSSAATDPLELVCCRHGRNCLIGRIEAEQRRGAKEDVGDLHTAEEKQTLRTPVKEPVENYGYENVSMQPHDLISPPKSPQYENLNLPKTVESAPSQLCDVFDFTDFYLGVVSKAKAARRCKARTSFYLYHRLEEVKKLGDLQPKLPLYIVYQASNGRHYHFSVVRSIMNATEVYYVDCGDKGSPKFYTLSSLMKYYSRYVQFHNTTDGNVDPDVFPWWIREKEN